MNEDGNGIGEVVYVGGSGIKCGSLLLLLLLPLVVVVVVVDKW